MTLVSGIDLCEEEEEAIIEPFSVALTCNTRRRSPTRMLHVTDQGSKAHEVSFAVAGQVVSDRSKDCNSKMVASRKRKVSTGAEVAPVAAKKTSVAKKGKIATPVAAAAAPLSAVAARRAAAAAALATQESTAGVEVEKKEEVVEDEEEVFLAVPEDSEDDNEQPQQPEAGPSSPPKHAKPSRYFAAAQKAVKSTPAPRKQVVTKAFSPSTAVVQLPDATDSEDEGEEVQVESDEEEEQSLGDRDEEEEEEDEVAAPIVPVVHVGRRARKGKG